MSKEQVAWVAKLSCGHVIGSKPPPPVDEDEYVRPSPAAPPYAPPVPKKRKHPPFRDAPDVGVVVLCRQEPCDGEGRYVVGLIENRDEIAPDRDRKRQGRSSASPSGSAPAS